MADNTVNEDKAPEMRPIQIRNTSYADIASQYETEAHEERKTKLGEYLDFMDDSMEEMDTLAQDILDGNIDNPEEFLNSINAFGNQPMEELGRVGEDMINAQARFTNQVNVFGSTIGGLEGSFRAVKDFTVAAGQVLGRAAKTGGKALSGLGKALGALLGTNKQMTDDEKYLEQIETELPEKRKALLKLPKQIDEAMKGIDEVSAQARDLGKRRVESLDKIDLYLCASSEVMRRFEEDYIPKMQEKAAASGSSADEEALNQMIMARDEFVFRREGLQGSLLQAQTTALQIKEMIDTMQTQKRQLYAIKTNQIPEWSMMMAQAGQAASMLKMAVFIQKGRKVGDETFKQLSDMLEKSHQMTLDSAGGSTVNIDLLLDGAKKVTKMLEEKSAKQAKLLEQSNQNFNKAQDAVKRLDALKEDIKQQKLLDAGHDKPQKKSARTAANDAATTATPAAPVTPAPAAANEDVAPAAEPTEQPKSTRPRRGAGPGATGS